MSRVFSCCVSIQSWKKKKSCDELGVKLMGFGPIIRGKCKWTAVFKTFSLLIKSIFGRNFNLIFRLRSGCILNFILFYL